MVTLEKKKEIVADLKSKFDEAGAVYLINFERMTVAETNEFRSEINEGGFDYKVAKNTLIGKALDGNETFQFKDEDLKGQSGLIFGYDDPVTPAKLIKKFFDDIEKPVLKAAIIEGTYYEGSKLKTLASLPTKEDMMSGIVGSLSSPASGIAGAIGGVMRDLANVIHEAAKKREEAA